MLYKEKTMGKNKIISKFLNSIALISPEYLTVSFFGFMAGFFISNMSISLNIDFLYGLLSIIFLIAGYNSFNAIYDIEIDKINKPNRPLPNKKISKKVAYLESIILFILSLYFSLILDLNFFYLIFIGVILSILYSISYINLKKRFILGSLIAIFLYEILPFFSGWFLGKTHTFNMVLFILILLPFFFVGGILKDFEDIRGDSTNKVHSLLSILGYKKTIITMYLLCIISLFMLLFSIYLNIILFFYLFSIIFILLVIINIYFLNKSRSIKRGRVSFHLGLLSIILFDLFIILFYIFFI